MVYTDTLYLITYIQVYKRMLWYVLYYPRFKYNTILQKVYAMRTYGETRVDRDQRTCHSPHNVEHGHRRLHLTALRHAWISHCSNFINMKYAYIHIHTYVHTYIYNVY